MDERLKFYSRFQEDGCHIWTACTQAPGHGNMGYGLAWNGKKIVAAHRLAWETYRGPIPAGLQVLHECDVPACINPAHLFLGTQLQNIADRDAKGRIADMRGAGNGRAKLTDSQVIAIRAWTGKTRAIAEKFSVSQNTVRAIKLRKIWRHLP